ncbi:MAG: oligosaccharide flippase family protein [Gemmatimonadetes bacterium]|nr:oligosaccharide flippase family protein [Gemmatimonadota bacterium]
MRVTGAVLALAFNLVLARYLGADGAGVYLLALTVVTVGTVLSRLGMDNALLRFVAGHRALDDWASVRGVHRAALAVSALVAAGITLLLVSGAPFLSTTVFGKPELTVPLQLLALATLPMSLALLQGESLKGIERIVPSQFIHWVVLPACLLALGWMVLPRWGAAGGAAAYVLGACTAAALAGAIWHRSLPHAADPVPPYPTSRLLRVSTPLMWATSLNMVMTWVGMVALGVLATTADVGIFGVASRLSVLVGFVVVAVNSVASPRFAALHAEGRSGELRRMVAITGGLMALAAGPVVVAVLILAEPILALFGPEFVAGAWPLRALCLGQAALVVTGPATPLLMMTGHEAQVRNAIGIAALAAVVLNVALVPEYGVNGAAVASAVSLPLVNVIAAIQAWRLTGVLTVPTPSLQGHGP